MAEQIDKKYLAGLKFKSSKKDKESGAFVPTERALQPADVLDWKDKGDTVVIVTADGKKHTVNKKAAEKGKAKGEAEGEGENEGSEQ